MRVVSVDRDFESFRDAARSLLAEGAPPESVWWEESQAPGLFIGAESAGVPAAEQVSLPGSFVERARRVACHRDPGRWSLLYGLFYRIHRGDRRLLLNVSDDQVRLFNDLDRQVCFDRHKMTAFVRFRKVQREGQTHYVAFHKPAHFIVGQRGLGGVEHRGLHGERSLELVARAGLRAVPTAR